MRMENGKRVGRKRRRTERGERKFYKVQVHESKGVAKVDGPARARPGVTRTCEQYIIYLLLCAETV